MKSSDLISFIEKYHLSKLVESAIWQVDMDTATVKFISTTNSTVGEIIFPFTAVGTFQFGIYNTSSLLRMIKVMSGDLGITFKREFDVLTKMEIYDGTYEGKFSLASVQSIPEVPEVAEPSVYDILFDLDDSFVKQFTDSYKAIEGVNRFTIGAENDIKIILGEKNTYSSKISFGRKASVDSLPLKPMAFSAESLNNIMKVNNKEKGQIEVSDKGIMKISYKGENWSAKYFIVQLEEV